MSRRNNRKQCGGGIFNTRLGQPVQGLVNTANELVGTELRVVADGVHGIMGPLGRAIRGITRGADGVVSSVARVVSRKSRKNNRK